MIFVPLPCSHRFMLSVAVLLFAEKFNVMFCNLTLCSGAQPLPPGERKIITLKHWNVAPGEKTHNTQHTALLPLRLAGDIYFIAARGFQHKTIMNVSIKIPIQLSPRLGFCFRWPKFSQICKTFDWAPAEQHRRGLDPVKLFFVLIEAGSHRNVLVIKIILCYAIVSVVSIKVWYMT